MKTLSLFVTDVDPALDPFLIKKLEAMVRNVRLTEGGWFRRGKKRRDDWPAHDWRHFYLKTMAKLFPQGWIYRGGHHLAVHASAPPEPKRCRPEPGAEAGRCLFRIIEVTKLHKLACDLHWGEVAGAQCRKCSAGITDRNLSDARNLNLVAAITQNP